MKWIKLDEDTLFNLDHARELQILENEDGEMYSHSVCAIIQRAHLDEPVVIFSGEEAACKQYLRAALLGILT